MGVRCAITDDLIASSARDNPSFVSYGELLKLVQSLQKENARLQRLLAGKGIKMANSGAPVAANTEAGLCCGIALRAVLLHEQSTDLLAVIEGKPFCVAQEMGERIKHLEQFKSQTAEQKKILDHRSFVSLIPRSDAGSLGEVVSAIIH